MSNPLHKINVCKRSASLIFKTRQVEDISLQNILNSAESKFGLINLCFQLSSTFHIELMPAPHRRGEGHSHVKICTGRPVASVKLLACKFSIPSLPPSLPAPSGVDLDYLPPNDLTRPQLWKNLSKILLKTLDCQLHGQLQCCYLNLKLILQPWPQIVQRISRASSKFLRIWTSGGMNNIWCTKTIFYVPAGCNLTLLKFMGAL